MKLNHSLRLLAALTLLLGFLNPAAAQIFIPDATLSLSGSVTVVETNQRLAFNANPNGGTPQTAGRTNLALAANGGSPFESSRISTYGDDKLNNGVYGAGLPDVNDSTRPWISLDTESNGWGGVKFAFPVPLVRFGFGSRFDNRSDGDFTMQYTTDSFAGVDLETPTQVNALTWTTFGTLTSTTPTEFGRHLFELNTPVASVTGVRVVASQGGSTITEIEAYAAYIPVVVTTLADNGAGSLRDEIANAFPGDTIIFDPSLSGQTITLGGTQLTINKDLTIDASALPDGITIDANNASRVIQITSGSVVTLDSLTISGGNAPGIVGGGIYVNRSSLTLQNSTISGNSASSGGGIFSKTNLSGLTTTLINCTLTNNSATTRGGGIYNLDGKTILTHCTITGNTAPPHEGSGVTSWASTDTDTEVFATIISGNTNSDVDLVAGAYNSFTSNKANLIGTGSATTTDGNATSSFSQFTDQVGITDPQLAPLANYGGPTQTMPPLSVSSPAVNAAITLAESPSTDQRGLPRISLPDIGAAEFQYFIPFVTTLADNGVGSLRDTIANATAGETITFHPALSGMTITLGGTQLTINKDLTIDASALPGGITIDGNNASRVIFISNGNVVTLDSLTITGGNATGSSGGGIYVISSSLTLQNSTLTGNTATSGGGLCSNTNLSDLTTTLINCTLTNNSATNYGGGIYNVNGKTILTHCTITGNTAPAARGSGVASYGDSFTETEVFATIISGNTNSDIAFVVAATNSFTSKDANLIGTGNATGDFNQPKDQAGITDPQLSPLGNYGGPTQTMPPLSGSSPAVNAAITIAGSPSTDQRGLPRIFRNIPDIGAAELQYFIPFVITLADSGVGSLRDTIASASPGSTITFDPALSGMTITLDRNQLTINKDLTIDASALPGGITIDANNTSRVIYIPIGSVVTLDSLTITGGNAEANVTGNGGGIDIYQSSLTLQNSTIMGNSATNGGGIYSNTNLSGRTTTLINCTLTNNSATAQGGGIINFAGKTVLTHCTITANTAPAGAGSGVASYGSSNTLTEVFATIISGNTNSDVDFVSNSNNSFTSTDANLIGTGNATGAFSQPKDQVGITNPQLSPLGNYGGPTQTMPPLSAASPAFNTAITIAGSPSTDQRGLPRIFGNIPDIGAAEFDGFIPIVTTRADNGAGSLRDKIANASPGETITFDPTLSGQSITLGGTQLTIDKDLSIDASALPDGITISGNNISRVFEITSSKTLQLRGVTVSDGQADYGGAIRNNGALSLTDCTVSDSTASSQGGGVYNYFGSITMANVTISGNVAAGGGGIWSAGGVSCSLTNCTVTGNQATNDAGIANENGAAALINCTLSENIATVRGGGYAHLQYGGATLAIENTIIAGNTAPSGADFFLASGTFVPSGNNLIGNNDTVETEFPTGLLVGTTGSPLNPQLAPLGNYGGPTQTMPLLPGSPAIEGGLLLAATPPTDQMGNPRPSGPLPDIGAVEALPISLLMLASSDGDDIPDILEGPGNAYPHLSPSVDDSAVDTDGDGSSDAEEIANMTDLLDPSSRFRMFSLAPAAGFDPTTNPVVEFTITTFPGLSYRLQSGATLTGFTDIPGSQFTATGFTEQFNVTLGANGDFVRVRRD